ncbi:MAG: hypothetical protein F9B45_07965 [Phycisphaera sp. RhM]|nr:hypothetical protein [Phycisphaera sp. RhM]
MCWPKRLFKIFRRTGLGLAIVALAILVSRNDVSRRVAEYVAASVLKTDVTIDSVFIGWGHIQVAGITVFDPVAKQSPQIEVGRVDLTTSLLQGLRDGVWFDHLAIDHPLLNVQFDPDGNLLSRFPAPQSAPSEGKLKIPIRSLAVEGAQVMIHQGDSQTAMVDGADLKATFGKSILIDGRVDKLIEGRVDFASRVDAVTYQGTTSLRVVDCRLDSESLPGRLLPESLRSQPFSGSVSLVAKAHHPASVDDLLHHPLQLKLQLHDLQLGDLETLVNEVTVTANSDSDGIAIDVVGDPLDGDAEVRIDVSSPVPPLVTTIETEVSDCSFTSLIRKLSGDLPMQASGSVRATTQIDWDGRLATFHHTMRAVAHDLVAVDIELDDVVCNLRCDGSLPVGTADVDMLSQLRGTLGATIQSDGLSLAQISDRLQIPDLQGRIAANADVQIPLETLLDPNTLVANARVNFQDISCRGVYLDNTQGQLEVESGKAIVQLPNATLKDVDGRRLANMSTVVRADLPTDEVVIDAQLDQASMQHIAPLCQLNENQFHGQIMGQLDATSSITSLAKPESWKSTASLRLRDLIVAGEPLRDAEIRGTLEQGHLVVPRTEFSWRENLCHVQALGTLNNQLVIDGTFDAGPIELEDVAELATRLSHQPLHLTGSASLSGKIHVDAIAKTFHSTGTAMLSDASYADAQIGSADLDWTVESSGVTLRTQSNDFLGGSYALDAHLAELDWTRTTLDLRFKEIQCLKGPELLGIDIPVTGTMEGGCRLTSIGALDDLRGNGWIRSRGVSIHQVPVSLNQGRFTIANGAAELSAEGESLNGTYNANAKCRLDDTLAFVKKKNRDLRRLPVNAKATLKGLSINQSVRSLGASGALQPLTGVVHASCVRDESTQAEGLICTASATAEHLSWHGKSLTDRSTATVRLHPDRLELSGIDGRLAGGRITGRGEVSLDGSQRGYFQLAVDRINLRQAAAPLGRSIKGVTGTASVQVDGRLGSVITGRAQISANHPSVSNLNVRAVRFPVDWSFTPATRRFGWRCRAGVIDAGAGKINVSTEGDFARTLNMRMTAKLDQIDTSRMLRGGAADLGIIDGRVHLKANRARSLNQISGTFDVNLSKVDSMDLPILDQLGALINLAPTLSTDQDNQGTIQGRLAGGLVHLDRLAISQSNVQVLMDGQATLDGRLDFDITAATGQTGPADGLAALASSPLLLAAPAPVALVLKANEAMKDRVVHVHVGGTASRPVLRLQPGKQLAQDTLRFFLKNSFGSQVADAVDTSRRGFR